MRTLTLFLGLLVGTTALPDPPELPDATSIQEQARRHQALMRIQRDLEQRRQTLFSDLEKSRPKEKDNAVSAILTSLYVEGYRTPETATDKLVSLQTQNNLTRSAAAYVSLLKGDAPPPEETEESEEAVEIASEEVPEQPGERLQYVQKKLVELGEDYLSDKEALASALVTAQKIASDELKVQLTEFSGEPTEEKHQGDVPKKPAVEDQDRRINEKTADIFLDGAKRAQKYFDQAIEDTSSLVLEETRLNEMFNDLNQVPDDALPPEPDLADAEPDLGGGDPGLGGGDPGLGGGDPGLGEGAPPGGEELPPGGEGMGGPGGPDSGKNPLAKNDSGSDSNAPSDSGSGSGSGAGGGGGGGGGDSGSQSGGGLTGGSGPIMPFAGGFSSFQGPSSPREVSAAPVAEAGRVVTLDKEPSKLPEAVAAFEPKLPPIVPSRSAQLPNRVPASIREKLQGGERSAASARPTSGSLPAADSGGGSIAPNPIGPSQAALAAAGGGSASGVEGSFQGNPFGVGPKYGTDGGSGIQTRRAAYGGGGGSVNEEVEPKQIRILKKQTQAQFLDQSAFGKSNRGLGIMKHVGTFTQWCKEGVASRVELCDFKPAYDPKQAAMALEVKNRPLPAAKPSK